MEQEIHVTEKHTRHIVADCILILCALIFLVIFSYNTSPLTRSNENDSGFFTLAGQAILHGKIPYRDFFDMKGPVFFFLEYLSQLICYGRMGCLLMQWVSLSAAMLLTVRIFRLNPLKHRITPFLLMIPEAVLLGTTLYGGNLTEEYALPWLLAALYGFLKHEDRAFFHVFCGFAVACMAFSRITNGAMLFAVVGSELLMFLVHKEFRGFVRCLLLLLLGMALCAVPVLVWFGRLGLLSEMFEDVFAFGFTYAVEMSLRDRFRFILPYVGFLVLTVFPVLVSEVWRRENRRLLLFCLLNAGLTCAVLFLGNVFRHYFILVVPCLVLDVYLWIRFRPALALWVRGLLVGVLVICTLSGAPYLKRDLQKIKGYILAQAEAGYTQASVSGYAQDSGITRQIPPEERDSVFDLNAPAEWYSEQGLFPCMKYCFWVEHYIELKPSIADEFWEEFRTAPPKWLVSVTYASVPNIFRDITAQYTERFNDGVTVLYRLKED